MTLNRLQIEWVAIAFFLVAVGIVFQQIHTDLAEQGIAGGDAFHNAAFYPRSVAILILGAILIRMALLTIEIRREASFSQSIPVRELFRPFQLTVLFALYLFSLGTLGYHLATAPFIAMTMFICGDKKPLPTLAFSISVAFLVAFLFEKYLKIVLPGGIFSLNIPW